MLRHIFIVVLILGLTACGRSPKTNFYMINVENASDSHLQQKARGVGIGVWKVELPILLDRYEIVTRADLYNIELADFHQWAGGLVNNMTRLIASELGRRLQTDRVVISPWSSYKKHDYQLKIQVQRFDGVLGGEVILSGAWSLLNAQGNKEIVRKSFNFKTQTKGEQYSDMVAALSQLTVMLSEQMAGVISIQDK